MQHTFVCGVTKSFYIFPISLYLFGNSLLQMHLEKYIKIRCSSQLLDCCIISLLVLYFGSRSNSVSIVSGYGLDDQAIEVRSLAGAKDFSSSPVSRPALVPIQPPVQWVPGFLSPAVKRG
jgi:hypothetical protein